MPGAPRLRAAQLAPGCAQGTQRLSPAPPRPCGPCRRPLPPPPAPRGRAPSPGRRCALPRPRGGGGFPQPPSSPRLARHLPAPLFIFTYLFIYLFIPGAARLKALEASPPLPPFPPLAFPAGRGRGWGQRGRAGPKPGQRPGRAETRVGEQPSGGEPQPPGSACPAGINPNKSKLLRPGLPGAGGGSPSSGAAGPGMRSPQTFREIIKILVSLRCGRLRASPGAGAGGRRGAAPLRAPRIWGYFAF